MHSNEDPAQPKIKSINYFKKISKEGKSYKVFFKKYINKMYRPLKDL